MTKYYESVIMILDGEYEYAETRIIKGSDEDVILRTLKNAIVEEYTAMIDKPILEKENTFPMYCDNRLIHINIGQEIDPTTYFEKHVTDGDHLDKLESLKQLCERKLNWIQNITAKLTELDFRRY